MNGLLDALKADRLPRSLVRQTTSTLTTSHTSKLESETTSSTSLSLSTSASSDSITSTKDSTTVTSITSLPTTLVTATATTSTSSASSSTRTSSIDDVQHTSGTAAFPSSCKTAIIITTVIGGSLILAFLLYALYRRRKGATYNEIVHFRRHSGITVSTPTMSALPQPFSVHQESRFSIRSSHLDLSRQSPVKYYFRRFSRKQSPLTTHFPDNYHQQISQPHPKTGWKKPDSRAIHPDSSPSRRANTNLRFTASLPRTPETAVLASSATTDWAATHRVPEMADMTKTSWLELSVRETASPSAYGPPSSAAADYFTHDNLYDDENIDKKNTPEDSSSQHPSRRASRWSWTNSQAPPTPRVYVPGAHMSMQSTTTPSSSLPQVRRVRTWVRGQRERRAQSTAEAALHDDDGEEEGEPGSQIVTLPSRSASSRRRLSKSPSTRIGKPPAGRRRKERTGEGKPVPPLPLMPAIRVQAPSVARR